MPDFATPPPPDPGRGWDPDDVPPPQARVPLAPLPQESSDPVAVVAVTAGFVGILFFGLVLALVAAILGAFAGQRARDNGTSLQQAYLAIFMGVVDAAVWIALHVAFEMPFWLG